MGHRRSESGLRDIDTLFRAGVVSALSDRQLLERFAGQTDSDGEIAFEAVVRRHGPMVLGVCRRALGDYHAAEDAFQATFLVLALKSDSIRKQKSLGPWLHGVALRIARRRQVQVRRGRGAPVPLEELVDPASHDAAETDIPAVVDEELGRLPEKYRLPIVLCYLEGRTQDEAARTLGWTKGTVSGRLARAKDLLRHRLTRRGLAPSVAIAAATSLTTGTSRGAVPASLLVPTVRAATAAILAGSERGLVTARVASLVRQASKVMAVGRMVRVAALLIVFGLGAAALATSLILPIGRKPSRGPAEQSTRPAASAARLDRFGSPLPPGAALRLGTTQRRHSSGVAGLGFTSDGAAAVTAQDDGLVRIWDSMTGRQVRVIDLLANVPTRDRSIRDFAVSPGGQTMAAAGFAFDAARGRIVHKVWIWDLKEDKLCREIEVATVDLLSLAFAPDGAAIATGGFAGAIQIWDVATGNCLASLKLGNAAVRSISFAPDGKIVAVCEPRKSTRLWNIDRGSETFLVDPSCGAIAPVFSPDGQLMAVSDLNGETMLYDRATGQKRLTAEGTARAFSPDSRSLVISGPEGVALKVVDTEVGSELWRSAPEWGPVIRGVAFAPDGKTMIAVRGGVLRFFEAGTGRERLEVSDAHQEGITAVTYTRDGRTVVTAGDDGTVREWDATTGRQIGIHREQGRIYLLAISADGAHLATASAGAEATVTVWNRSTGAIRQRWAEPGGTVGTLALAFSAEGDDLLAFDHDRGLLIREIATGRERDGKHPDLADSQQEFLGIGAKNGAFSPGNEFLALSTATAAYVAALASGSERLAGPAHALAFAADGISLAIATPGKPAMNQLADGSYRTPGPVVDGIDFVNLRTMHKRRIAIRMESVTAMALKADARVVAVAGGWSDPAVRLYRTDDGRELAAFRCPARVTHAAALAFAPDGQSLAAGLDDTTVLIWNTRDVR